MSDTYSVAFDPSQADAHPHDLLARLYHEIGLSAVAAALEAFTIEQLREMASRKDAKPTMRMGEDLAA